MFWPRGRCLAYNLTSLPNLLIIFPNFFAQHFVRDLNYPIFQLQASFDVCVCVHIPLTLWVSTSSIVLMVTNALEPMMQFATPLPP